MEMAEGDARPTADQQDTRIRPGRADRRHLRFIAAAAMILIGLGVAIGLLFVDLDETIHVELDGTNLAPGAAATAELDDRPQGLRIKLAVTGLAPAQPGFYYQAWLRSGDEAVAAGTFHLRGGDAEIELWAGVSAAEYPRIVVTLEQVGGRTEGPPQVMLETAPSGTDQ